MQRQYKSLLFLRELDNEPEIDVGKKNHGQDHPANYGNGSSHGGVTTRIVFFARYVPALTFDPCERGLLLSRVFADAIS